jgi:hypothetical protein
MIMEHRAVTPMRPVADSEAEPAQHPRSAQPLPGELTHHRTAEREDAAEREAGLT